MIIFAPEPVLQAFLEQIPKAMITRDMLVMKSNSDNANPKIDEESEKGSEYDESSGSDQHENTGEFNAIDVRDDPKETSMNVLEFADTVPAFDTEATEAITNDLFIPHFMVISPLTMLPKLFSLWRSFPSIFTASDLKYLIDKQTQTQNEEGMEMSLNSSTVK